MRDDWVNESNQSPNAGESVTSHEPRVSVEFFLFSPIEVNANCHCEGIIANYGTYQSYGSSFYFPRALFHAIQDLGSVFDIFIGCVYIVLKFIFQGLLKNLIDRLLQTSAIALTMWRNWRAAQLPSWWRWFHCGTALPLKDCSYFLDCW